MRGQFIVKPPEEPPPSLPAPLKASDAWQSFSPDASPSHGAALPCSRANIVMPVPAATASPGQQPAVLTTA